MTDDQKLQAATELVRAMMRSVPPKTIRAIDWWERARNALEIAAMSSSSFSSLISEMGRKLQIVATRKVSGVIVADIDTLIGPHFEAFRSYCEREALYIIAMCQAASEASKAEWAAIEEAGAQDFAALNEFTKQAEKAIPLED